MQNSRYLSIQGRIQAVFFFFVVPTVEIQLRFHSQEPGEPSGEGESRDRHRNVPVFRRVCTLACHAGVSRLRLEGSRVDTPEDLGSSLGVQASLAVAWL